MCIIMKDKGCSISTIGYYLVVAGAVNWGLVGLGSFFGADWNIVHMLFGSMMTLESLIYLVIGLSGLMLVVGCKCGTCNKCRVDMGTPATDKPKLPEVKI